MFLKDNDFYNMTHHNQLKSITCIDFIYDKVYYKLNKNGSKAKSN